MRAIFIFCFALFVSTVFGAKATAQSSQQENLQTDYKSLGAAMPHFEIKTTNGKSLTEKNFEEYESIVLVLFNPTCEHCIDLGKAIAENPKTFRKTALVYIAANGMDDYLGYFTEQTGLEKVMGKNIVMGTDQTPNAGLGNSFSVFLAQLFEYQLPQVNVYNKERKMIFKHSGAISLQELTTQIR